MTACSCRSSHDAGGILIPIHSLRQMCLRPRPCRGDPRKRMLTVTSLELCVHMNTMAFPCRQQSSCMHTTHRNLNLIHYCRVHVHSSCAIPPPSWRLQPTSVNKSAPGRQASTSPLHSFLSCKPNFIAQLIPVLQYTCSAARYRITRVPPPLPNTTLFFAPQLVSFHKKRTFFST